MHTLPMTRAGLALLLALGFVAGGLTPRLDAPLFEPLLDVAAADATVTACDESSFDAALTTVQTTGGGTITFDCSGTLTFTDEKTITQDVTIDGAGQAVIFDGDGSTRLFVIDPGARLALNDLTLQNADAPASSTYGGAILNTGGGVAITAVSFASNDAVRGGAIYNDGGSVVVTSASFVDNRAGLGGAIYNRDTLSVATSSFVDNGSHVGGAIYNEVGTLSITQSDFSLNSAFDAGAIHNNGTAEITASTFNDNSASNSGGAIYNRGTLTVTNSTLSANNANVVGGAIYNDGAGVGMATLTNNTVSGNSAGSFGGGAIWNNNGAVNLAAMILSDSQAPDNCAGASLNSQGENLSDDDSCDLDASGDLVDTDPMLLPLADNGGLTLTHLPQSGSPAIDAAPSCGAPSGPSTDQRGAPRPLGGACDIGSVETVPVGVVAFCTEAAFDDALAVVQDSGGGTLTFACSGTIIFTSQKTITTAVTILGNGDVRFDGNNSSSLFQVNPGATLSLADLTLQNATNSGGGSAAINNNGTLEITASTLSGNSASFGAAINSAGTVTITASTFSNNRANLSADIDLGGAIYNAGTLTITASTFSGNTSDYGGAIYNEGSATITASTFSDNSALGGGAIYNSQFSNLMTISASILTNSPGSNCSIFNKPSSGGSNLSDDGSCGFGASGDIQNSSAINLGALQDNGGPTLTMLPQSGSAAIDAANCALSSPTDQRGVARPQNTDCDIGAVEVQTPIVGTPSVSPAPSEEGQSVTASATFSNPDGVGSVTCTVDYGDGNGPQGGTIVGTTCTGPAHTYLDNAPGDSYTVTVAVSDTGSGTGSNATSHTVNNVAPSIDSITTNGPLTPGQPVTITVQASDPGVNDVLSYRFDCDGDGGYDVGSQPGDSAGCPLDPGAASTTLTVEVSDDDGGVTTGSVTVSQFITLCGNFYTGALTTPTASGCPSGSMTLTLPGVTATTICINPYSGAMNWASTGSCGQQYLVHSVPDDGPLHYCESLWTGQMRANLRGGNCNASEQAGVIPG